VSARFDPARRQAVAAEIIQHAAELARLGWTPVTSSNFSMRLDGDAIAITASGLDKGRLREEDIIAVDLGSGRALGQDRTPSAETPLHVQLYRRDARIGSVLHTHSRVQTVASRLFIARGAVRFEGYELAKAFTGVASHETAIELPVLPNSQDMAWMAAQVDAALAGGPRWGYLIAGHGLYAWGATIVDARRHLEAFEFLLACELDMRTQR
jgi:methylthioribulose-1-phosphate dehydratase